MRIAILILCLSIAAVSGVAAQDQGVTVGATVSAASIDSTTALSISSSAGYQIAARVALEIEATAVPRVKLAVDALAPVPLAAGASAMSSVNTLLTTYPGAVLQPTDGRAVIFTSNIRLHVLTTATRVAPFVVAGGGIANLRRSMDITLPVLSLPPGVPIPIRPITQPITSSATALALTIGGGVDVRLAAHVAMSLDLRYFRLLAERDSNMGRFGAGIRYRF